MNHQPYNLYQEADFIDDMKERCISDKPCSSEERDFRIEVANGILCHALWSLGYKELVDVYENL